MDLQHISESDWLHFTDNYPRAYQFLLHASLIGEWQNLLAIRPDMRTDWQAKRCDELKNLLTMA